MRSLKILAAAIPLLIISAQTRAQISGPRSLCEGTTIILSETVLGGVWTSDNHSIATISPTTAMVTGVAPGVAIIHYMSDTFLVTVTALHFIMGGAISVCSGDTVNLTDPLIVSSINWQFSSGWPHWLSGTPPHLDATTGMFTGTTLDTGKVYAAGIEALGLASCGIVTISVISAPSTPSVIAGPSSVGIGGTIHLSDPTPSGTWRSSNTAIATVDASGNVSGVMAGIDTVYYTVSNSCGDASVFQRVTVIPSTTSVQEIAQGREVSLYPNPATDFMTIEAEGIKGFKIFDQTGRVTASGELTERKSRLDVSKFPAGAYYIAIQTDKNIFRQTIFITH